MTRLIIIALIYILLPKISFTHNLEETVVNTQNFFGSLKKKYETTKLNDQIKILIDQEIAHYFKMISKEFEISHSKRELHTLNIQETGVEIFKGLEEIVNFNMTDVRDINFFKRYSGYEQWFGITLTSTNIIVYGIQADMFVPVTSYPIADAFKIYVTKFQGNILFISQKLQSITVSYFFHQDGKFAIREVTNLTILDIKDLSFWRTSDQLFLAVSSSSKIYVYAGLQEKSDPLQTLPSGGFLTILHPDKDSLYLIARSQRECVIFHYERQMRKFIRVQTIRQVTHDVSVVIQAKTRISSSRQYLLALASDEGTRLYRRSTETGAFVAFQRIGPADRIVSVGPSRDNLIPSLLLLLRDGCVEVYQYDGSRFVRLEYQLREIVNLRIVDFDGEQRVLIRRAGNSWSLNSINWIKIKEPMNPNQYLKQWCSAAKEKAKVMPKSISEAKNPIRIFKGQIKEVKAKSVNGTDVQKLQNLTQRYHQLISRLAIMNESLSQTIPAKNPHFANLGTQIVRVSCRKQCTAKKLITKLKCDFFSKLRRIDDEAQTLKFEHLKIDKLDGFPSERDGKQFLYCPVPGVELEDVNVKGLVNGIDLNDLQENVLRTSGDQNITGEHIIANLQVDSLIGQNLDVASTLTRQTVQTRAVRAKELILTDGGLLLPLNGEQPVRMTGSLVAERVKLEGPIELRCGIRGVSVRRLAPMKDFLERQVLEGDYTLEGTTRVSGLLASSDIARQEAGPSLREIADGIIPLGESRVPVHLVLLNNQTSLTNVTVEKLPNWLIRNNSQMAKVTGKKTALKSVILPDAIYSELPIPKLQAYACSIGAIASDIRTSTLRISNATAKTVVSDNVYGARELENVMMGSVTSLDEADLSRKTFTGVVNVENLNISNFENSPFRSFQKAKFKWYRPNLIEGPIKVKDLKVGSLTALKGIKIPSPKEIRNMIVEGDLQVNRINGINLDEFIRNIVRIHDTVSMKNVIFAGSLEVDEVETINTNINLENLEKNAYLGNKIIAGDLKVEDDLSIPIILSLPPADEFTTLIVEGTIRFEKEPEVENINRKNLHQLISEIWILNRPTNLTGNFIMKNITLSQTLDLFKLLNTPTFGPWKSLENRLLSKTKLQDIQVPVHFREAKIPNIKTRGNTTLRSLDPYLNDLLYMTLKKYENQTIQDKWRINELIIKDGLMLFGKINNLNLSSDIARHDVEVNRVTGVKVVNELTVRNLDGLNFGIWAKDALMHSDIEKLAVINGKKTFNTINARILNVSGTVMGKKLEDCLLTTGDQIITAPKIIRGSLHAPSLLVEGLINDMNLTDFVDRQLESHKSVQSIKSKIIFNGNLTVVGHVMIEGTIQGIELKKINSINESLAPVMNAVAYLKPFATGIETTMKHRAKYWNKFEYVEGNVTLFDSLTVGFNDSMTFHKLGNCILKSISELVCNEQNIFFLKMFGNSTDIMINQMISVYDVPLVVQISSGPRSRITIHVYDYTENYFDVAASLRVPGLTRASLMSLEGVVWIVARLRSQMLLVRFEPWGELRKYPLPDSRLFALGRVPASDELALVREDGVWKLDGLAGPRHVFKASLRADRIDVFSAGDEFYVRLACRSNGTRLLRARYVGV